MSANAIDIRGIDTPRLSEYFGIWAMEGMRFGLLFERAKAMDIRAHVAGTPPPRIKSQTQKLSASAAGLGPTASPTIAVITIAGTLMKQQSSMDESTSTVQLRRDIRAAAVDPSIGGIILVIDSPGGSVSGTADVAAEVGAAAMLKPVTAFVEDLCASAAFWIASQATRIVANNATALVGSIGTFIGLYDYSGAAAKDGIKAKTYVTGSLKGSGFPGSEITPEQDAYFQGIVDQTQQHFAAGVMSGREMTAEQVATVATGGVFSAPDALSLGLIDAIESFDQTVDSMWGDISAKSAQSKEPMKMATNPANPKADDTNKPVEPAKPAEEQPKKTEEEKEAEKPAEKPAETGKASTEGQRFVSAFGPQGAMWFVEGKTFQEATVLHATSVADENKTLKARLASIDRGEATPVAGNVASEKKTGQAGVDDARKAQFAKTCGPKLAAFASAIKLEK